MAEEQKAVADDFPATHDDGEEEEEDDEFSMFPGFIEEPVPDGLAPDCGFDEAELATCLKVMSALHNNKELLASKPLKEFRKSLDPFLDDRRERYFGGQSATDYELKLKTRRMWEGRRARLAAQDRDFMNSSQLRADRIAALERLKMEGAEDLGLVPDGVAADGGGAQLLLGDGTGGGVRGGAVRAIADAPPADKAGSGDGDGDGDGGEGGDGEGEADGSSKFKARSGYGAAQLAVRAAQTAEGALFTPKSCYMCKRRYTDLHFFYASLCPDCGVMNYERRNQTADLSGRVALLTGCRVKIGFQVGLKLLRGGAILLGTTRFPRDAAARYAQEADFEEWRDRLHLFGLDLRDLPAIERFTDLLCARFDRLDVIVNNACQTIRRPPAYYRHLIANELLTEGEVGERLRPLLAGNMHVAGDASLAASATAALEDTTTTTTTAPAAATAAASGVAMSQVVLSSAPAAEPSGTSFAAAPIIPPTGSGEGEGGVIPSAALSQLPLVAGDEEHSAELFPVGTYDVNQQQVDLRRHNSWLLKLEEVSTPEVVEVFAINALAPFIINSRLHPLMLRCTDVDRYIINVSAMEGKFYRFKTANHPHTNMAKAALNMMTRTAAVDYAKQGIYMNAVDTGWINDENPVHRAASIAAEHNFQTPIDEVDAAARILDPLFQGVLNGCREHGQFFKDYHHTEW